MGAGHRALLYASYAQHHPDELQIVAVADPVPLRREQTTQLHDISRDRCYTTAEEVAEQPKFADVVINGTARPSRSIHLLGTRGEIQGVFEDSRFVIRHRFLPPAWMLPSPGI